MSYAFRDRPSKRVQKYISSGESDVNPFLRVNVGKMDRQARQVTRTIDSVSNREPPLSEDKVLWRGVRSDRIKHGEPQKAFISATTRKEEAEAYQDQWSDVPERKSRQKVTYKIHAPKGSRGIMEASPHMEGKRGESFFAAGMPQSSSGEHIFPRGSIFHRRSETEDENGKTVELEYKGREHPHPRHDPTVDKRKYQLVNKGDSFAFKKEDY